MNTGKLTDSRHRDTGLAITLIFAILLVVLAKNIFLVCLITSLVLTMVNPKWCFFITPVWFGLSNLLGMLVSKIIFTVIFLLLAIPVGMLRKILGKDPMRLKLYRAGPQSAMVDRNHVFTEDDLKNPY